MDYNTRKTLLEQIEAARKSRAILYVTGDRRGLETRISPEVLDIFVDHLDAIGVCKRISLILHTNGGETSAAWRLINVLQTFCDELEVLIPLKAYSAGTLMSLGAHKIVMTKQASLGPIDPSLYDPLGPQVPGNPKARAPVSVEAVRGYLDEATKVLKISAQSEKAQIFLSLAQHVHPLVLGQIFRSRQQIRFLAEKLLPGQVKDPKQRKKIIDFLCSESGSHDYSVNRREAVTMGLNIEKPTAEFYKVLWGLHKSYATELELANPYDPTSMVTAGPFNYRFTRALIESVPGGSHRFVSEGILTPIQIPNQNPAMPAQPAAQDQRTFEGWKKL